MNGVHPPNFNRFRELDLSAGKIKSNKNKRPRPEDFIPLPKTSSNEQNLPRYLVASTVPQKNTDIQVRPLASYNVFQVERGLNFISQNRLEVKEMKSGDLLIKVPDNKTAQMFLKSDFIDCIPVKFLLHKTLNTIQGRIFSKKIIEISQEELLESLKDQKVVDVRKITKKENDRIIATGAAIITFDLIHRPDALKLGWERVPVEEYIPNPMRCVNCQRLGHTKKWCKSVEQCKECGYSEKHESCNRKYCINCKVETHTSYDPECPTFWKYKSVNYIKIARRCTTREAWRIFNENPTLNTLQPLIMKKKATYAQMANSVATTNNNNSDVQIKTNHPVNLSNSKRVNDNKPTENYQLKINKPNLNKNNDRINITQYATTDNNFNTTTIKNNINQNSNSQLTDLNSLSPVQTSYPKMISLNVDTENITDEYFQDIRDGKSLRLDINGKIDENLTEQMMLTPFYYTETVLLRVLLLRNENFLV